MDLKSLTISLTMGGKAFLTVSGIGLIALGLYSFLIDDPVVYAASAVLVIEALAVLIGGYYGGLSAGSVGWVHGGMVAALALVIISLVKLLVFGTAPALEQGAGAYAGGIILLGSLGGVAGINLRYARRSSARRRYLGS